MSRAGFVLTGGQSRRLGRDKALLPWRGRTLVEWVAGEVRDAAGNVTLVGAPDRYAHLGLPTLDESYAGCGPLSGIHAALSAGRAEWHLVVACDMPMLDANVLGTLLDRAAESGCQVAAARRDQWLEPLCAVYHASVLPVVSAALERGEFAVWKVLQQVRTQGIDVSGDLTTQSINTFEEWQKLVATEAP